MALSQSPDTAAILVAGGRGERFAEPGEESLAKQFLELGGRPVYLWSLATLCTVPAISMVVVVARQEMHERIASDVAQFMPQNERKILLALAGKTRQDSVRSGLEMAAAQPLSPRFVFSHDAARPFVSGRLLKDFIEALYEGKACAVATPLTDTIKRVEGVVIKETLDRNQLFSVQTPQGCGFEMLMDAHRRAKQEEFETTDDVALLERLNVSVEIVIGSPLNFKITNPHDMRVARALADSFLIEQ